MPWQQYVMDVALELFPAIPAGLRSGTVTREPMTNTPPLFPAIPAGLRSGGAQLRDPDRQRGAVPGHPGRAP